MKQQSLSLSGILKHFYPDLVESARSSVEPNTPLPIKAKGELNTWFKVLDQKKNGDASPSRDNGRT